MIFESWEKFKPWQVSKYNWNHQLPQQSFRCLNLTTCKTWTYTSRGGFSCFTQFSTATVLLLTTFFFFDWTNLRQINQICRTWLSVSYVTLFFMPPNIVCWHIVYPYHSSLSPCLSSSPHWHVGHGWISEMSLATDLKPGQHKWL